MQTTRTTPIAKLIASASVAFAIFAGLAACQEPSSEVTVGAQGEDAAAPAADELTTPDLAESTVGRDTAADDGGGLPADGALLAAAEQAGDPTAYVTREALDQQAAEAAAALAAQTPTTTAPPAQAPTTTAAPVAAAAPAPAPTPAPAVVAPAPAPDGGMSASEASFLACVRQRESSGNYGVVSANGLYYGAYQFHRSTWDSTASHAGRGDLVGVAPNTASPADQDAMALHLYRWQGSAPWGGYC